MCPEPARLAVPKASLLGRDNCSGNRQDALGPVRFYLGLSVPGLEMPLRFRICCRDLFTSPPPCTVGDCPLCPREAGAEWALSLVKSNKSPRWEAAAEGNKG